jgi:hypothetical protein
MGCQVSRRGVAVGYRDRWQLLHDARRDPLRATTELQAMQQCMVDEFVEAREEGARNDAG